jgi:tellurite methyltransferase
VENDSIAFFESQFQKQVRDQAYELNPFEQLAINYLKGDILDLGAGLGNLSLAAGRRGHAVTAVDASPTAVRRINADAQKEGLPVRAIEAHTETRTIDRDYDTIVAIGLLMFFRRDVALPLLRTIQEHIKPGGRAVINVLIEGTTYMDMFDRDNYFLFPRGLLEEKFAGWSLLVARYQSFPAPGNTVKEFVTVIAEKKQSGAAG